MGIQRIGKLRKPFQRRTPQGADIGCLGSPPPNTASGNARSEESPLASQLAWDLFESARTSLTPRERDAVAINLATREFLYVIKLSLAAAVRANAAIPTDLAHHLMRWAQTYDGHPDHPAICSLLARATSTRRPAIYRDRPLRIHSAVQTDTQASQ